MDPNEPQFIKFEEIPLPEDKGEPESDDDESSSSSSDDEHESSMARAIPPKPEYEKADEMRAETIETILDCIVLPRKIEKNGKPYLLRLSRELANRSELVELSRKFEDYLDVRKVRMQGYCPIRRGVYDLMFDELIRQATTFCPERGALLLRVRDEFRMTLAAYNKLFENGMEYGTRKALEAEVETQSLQLQHSQLEIDVARAEKRIKDLQAEVDAEEALSKHKIDMKQMQHEEKMEFLKKAHKQLKEQLSVLT